MHTVGFNKHDHAACVGGGLRAAEETCAKQGLRLTKGRRRVLEILLQEHRAMGAYDILSILAEEGYASQPPVVYRALDFLVGNGFVHKIQKLNAYVACAHPGDSHTPVFLICRGCEAVAETAATLKTTLGEAAKKVGFTIETTIVEAEGLCPVCTQTNAAGAPA
ncbi:transcriptional repressor [Shimia sp. R11_0]|uniref:transcriptional repressor n=1 Tax=Shimia sp. R11_0 TaxID=2821096 RepID=UPI001ADC69DC|nr:transcriptional repressor [Shimia sp. R11_0]MBO9478679.1 transcriptional repressor [Shimia sp. R11_0]